MTQQTKKPQSQSSSSGAKLASTMANKAAKTAFAATDAARNSAENVVKIGSNAIREFMSTSSEEAEKAREKAFAIGREGAEHFAKSADAVTKGLYECIALSRDNVDTCMECCNMAAELAQNVTGECCEYANQCFADQMEISKEFFGCRTLNDMFDLQNKLVRNSIDQFFNCAVKLSGMFFEYSTEALEPINQRVAEASEQFGKIMAA